MNVTNIDEYLPHKISEVICINCKYRWIAIRGESVLLKNLECPKCNQAGFVINTGEDLLENLSQ